MHERNRPTIGVIVSGITDHYTEQLCTGIVNAVKHEDANLVIIPVKYIDRDLSLPGLDRYEYQNKILSSFLTPKNMDAIIIAADCVGCLTKKENLIRFLESLKDIPMVLVASRIEGYLSVGFDNVPGIIEGITYLAEKLDCKRICMVGGPDDNSDAYERKRAYLDTLGKLGLPFEERMYVEGDLTRSCNAACGKLIDENPDADAVFCVNDDTAYAFYQEMEARNLVPGEDILVFGFDNSEAGARAKIPLSSVDADPILLGKQAVRYVMKLLDGEVSESILIPTRFLARESIGKIDDTVSYEKDKLLDKSLLDNFFDEVFYRYLSIEDEDDGRLRKKYKLLMSTIIDYSSDHVLTGIELKAIGVEIDRFLKGDAIYYTDTNRIVNYAEKLFWALDEHMEVSGRDQEIILARILKTIIHALDGRIADTFDKQSSMLNDMKTHIKLIQDFKYGNDQSYVNMVSALYWMDINNAFVYIFDKPVTHLNGEPFPTPKYMRLKATVVDGSVSSIPRGKQKVSIDDIFDNSFMHEWQKISVLLPIFFDEDVYGIALCEMTDKVYKNGDFLANQFGSAARLIDTLKTNSEIMQQLEESLAVMRTHNLELDKISKNDALTGIYNRRGFEMTAESLLAGRSSNGLDTIVSFVDMNNLKIVNDRFGHEEGDCALRGIAEILGKVIADDGIIARVGGDEFNFVYTGECSESELLTRFKQEFDSFNENSGKPYRVTASIGFARIKGGESAGLKAALEIADRDLYKAKQNKDNVILKDMD